VPSHSHLRINIYQALFTSNQGVKNWGRSNAKYQAKKMGKRSAVFLLCMPFRCRIMSKESGIRGKGIGEMTRGEKESVLSFV
jgi:hypothetical protein